MTPGVELVFEANEQYWRKPSIKRIVFKGVPERLTRLAMLKTGEADLATFMIGDEGGGERRPEAAAGGNHCAGHLVAGVPRTVGHHLPWHDRRVRLAATLAIDKQALLEVERLGLGRPTGSIIPRALEFALSLEPFPYDPARPGACWRGRLPERL